MNLFLCSPILALLLLAIAPTSNGIVSGWIGPYKPMLSEQDSTEFNDKEQHKVELIETGRPDRPDAFFLIDTEDAEDALIEAEFELEQQASNGRSAKELEKPKSRT